VIYKEDIEKIREFINSNSQELQDLEGATSLICVICWRLSLKNNNIIIHIMVMPINGRGLS